MNEREKKKLELYRRSLKEKWLLHADKVIITDDEFCSSCPFCKETAEEINKRLDLLLNDESENLFNVNSCEICLADPNICSEDVGLVQRCSSFADRYNQGHLRKYVWIIVEGLRREIKKLENDVM